MTLRLPGRAGRRRAHGARRSLLETIGNPVTTRRRASLEVVALDNLSLTIGQGQRVGIIGHNGAGKSVLLRVMAGIYAPSSGNCEVRGRVSTMLTTLLSDYRDATGLEYIMLVGLTRGLTRREIDRRVPEIVRFSEIGDYLHLPVRTYSTGMRTRLMFAIATCVDSDVLLIDEDIGAGDLRFRSEVGKRILSAMTAASTLVIASQEARIIREFCDTVVWIHKGRLRGMGDVEELLDAYRVEQTGGSAARRERAEGTR